MKSFNKISDISGVAVRLPTTSLINKNDENKERGDKESGKINSKKLLSITPKTHLLNYNENLGSKNNTKTENEKKKARFL